MSEKIVFNTEEGDVLFYVLEETRMNGINYLLVAESEDDDAECYILKDTSGETSEEACYEMVEEDDELDALSMIFSSLLEDTDIIKEQ